MQTKKEQFLGEFFGTLILVFFGCGSVFCSVTTGAQSGIFQVAIVWGLGITFAIFLTSALSGAHLNPAVTLAMAVFRGFPLKRVPLYWSAQLLGAFAGAAILYLAFGEAIVSYEAKNEIQRGQPGSEASGMVFGQYFPNPNGKALDKQASPPISSWRACVVECIGTAVLLLVIFGVTDERNGDVPGTMVAASIGLTVTSLISLFGPLTMASFNPARDLGPRLFSCLAGWGAIPFQANGSGWLTVYILAPLVGGLCGGYLYTLFFKPSYLAEPAFRRR